MKVEQLEMFCALAELGSIRAAAEHLKIPPQSMSREMSNLERDLGVALYTRSPRGITLTSAGMYLRTQLESILPKLRRVCSELISIDAQEHQSRVLTIAGSINTASVAAAALPRFYERCPNVICQNWFYSHNKLGEVLNHPSEETPVPDMLMLRISPSNPVLEQVRRVYLCRQLQQVAVCLQLPENHPLAAKERIPAELFENEPILCPASSPEDGYFIMQLLDTLGVHLSQLNFTSNTDYRETARHNHQLCLTVPPTSFFPPLHGMVYRDINPSTILNDVLALRREPNPALASAFISMADCITELYNEPEAAPPPEVLKQYEDLVEYFPDDEELNRLRR